MSAGIATPLRRICVFCGSSPGVDPRYVEAARSLGRELIRRKLGFVYGGASVGVMGAIADVVLAGSGDAIGVIPRSLATKEIAHAGLTELHVVGTMHERKALMAQKADAFIALPGGFGTLDELFEILTWAQLGLHPKPCALLNVAGYFDSLLAFIDHSIREGFVKPEHRSLLLVGDDAGALIDRCAAYVAPEVPKWLRRGDE